MVALRRSAHRTGDRAYWLQQSCRRALRVFNVEAEVQGPVPKSGLLACNHLGYLDILVLSTLTPAVFVAKREVKYWPILGWFAILAGTVFADRQQRTRVREAVEKMESVLKTGVVTVLFPEGTSSDGRTVLPFKSSLLEPATKSSSPLSVCSLSYGLEDGDPDEEVCYWKDMTFFPHLLNLLTKRCIRASVQFSETLEHTANRKELARVLHLELLKIHNQRRCCGMRQTVVPVASDGTRGKRQICIAPVQSW